MYKRVISSMARRGMLDGLSDSMFLKLVFPVQTGYQLNLKAPKTYNEKLNWLKLNDRKPIYTIMADKYRAKDFVASRIGKQYVVPVLETWDSVEEISLDSMPEKFVLKTNHDSGSVQICREKEDFDFEKAKENLSRSMSHNYYLHAREWPYRDIKKKIFAEKFLEMGNALVDYKVMCFNGNPQAIQLNYVGQDRHSQDFYDTKWNKMDISQSVYAPVSAIENPKPAFLDEMLEMSKILARDTYYLRVDWFIAEEKLYSGELTFFDGAGWTPFDDYKTDLELGKLMALPFEK